MAVKGMYGLVDTKTGSWYRARNEVTRDPRQRSCFLSAESAENYRQHLRDASVVGECPYYLDPEQFAVVDVLQNRIVEHPEGLVFNSDRHPERGRTLSDEQKRTVERILWAEREQARGRWH